MTRRNAAPPNSHLFTASFKNPEITAMSAICDLLEALPDDRARLRVMHWAFGRYAEQFKRGVEPMAAAEVAAAPAAAAQPSSGGWMDLEWQGAPVEAAPVANGSEDFRQQISELDDLFERPARRSGPDPFLDLGGL